MFLIFISMTYNKVKCLKHVIRIVIPVYHNREVIAIKKFATSKATQRISIYYAHVSSHIPSIYGHVISGQLP